MKAARLAKAKQLADKQAIDEGVPAEQIEMDLGETPEPELAPNEQLRRMITQTILLFLLLEKKKEDQKDQRTFPPEAGQTMDRGVQAGSSGN